MCGLSVAGIGMVERVVDFDGHPVLWWRGLYTSSWCWMGICEMVWWFMMIGVPRTERGSAAAMSEAGRIFAKFNCYGLS